MQQKNRDPQIGLKIAASKLNGSRLLFALTALKQNADILALANTVD